MSEQKQSRLTSLLRTAVCTVAIGGGIYLTYKCVKNKLEEYLKDRSTSQENEDKINQLLITLQKELIVTLTTLFQSPSFAKKMDEKFKIDQLQERLKLCYSSEAIMTENLKEVKLKHWESLKTNGNTDFFVNLSIGFQRTICLVYIAPIVFLFYQVHNAILKRQSFEKEIRQPTSSSSSHAEGLTSSLLTYHLTVGIQRLMEIISSPVNDILSR